MKKESGLPVLSFIISLISICVCCGILSPVSLILSIIAVCKTDKDRGLSIAGLVLSIIGTVVLLVSICYLILFAFAVITPSTEPVEYYNYYNSMSMVMLCG